MIPWLAGPWTIYNGLFLRLHRGTLPPSPCRPTSPLPCSQPGLAAPPPSTSPGQEWDALVVFLPLVSCQPAAISKPQDEGLQSGVSATVSEVGATAGLGTVSVKGHRETIITSSPLTPGRSLPGLPPLGKSASLRAMASCQRHQEMAQKRTHYSSQNYYVIMSDGLTPLHPLRQPLTSWTEVSGAWPHSGLCLPAALRLPSLLFLPVWGQPQSPLSVWSYHWGSVYPPSSPGPLSFRVCVNGNPSVSAPSAQASQLSVLSQAPPSPRPVGRAMHRPPPRPRPPSRLHLLRWRVGGGRAADSDVPLEEERALIVEFESQCLEARQ